MAVLGLVMGVPSLAPAQGYVLFRIDGAIDGDRFGEAVAAAGDVDGDGFDDVIVGAPLADLGVRTDAGRATVVSGRTHSPLFVLDGTSAFDWFGFSVAGAGDVDGDGFGDVIVGAPLADPTAVSTVADSAASSVRPAATSYWSLSHASGAASVRRAARGACRISPHISRTACCPTCRYASGCSRSRFRCATRSRMTRICVGR